MPYPLFEQLTKKRLEEMKPGPFATGTVSDNPVGVHMTGSDRLLRWVAVRGYAPDWAIYIHYAEHDQQYVADSGDKVSNEHNIKKLVDCDDEALRMYR